MRPCTELACIRPRSRSRSAEGTRRGRTRERDRLAAQRAAHVPQLRHPHGGLCTLDMQRVPAAQPHHRRVEGGERMRRLGARVRGRDGRAFIGEGVQAQAPVVTIRAGG